MNDRIDRIEFRAGPVAGPISDRTGTISEGLVARRDLERYYALLDHELARVELSEAEASLICDALNGTLMDPHSYRLLWAEVADAVRLDGLDAKWGVDGDALVERLRALSPGAMMAVVDAVERFWLSPNPLGENLRRVGLVRDR